MLKITHSAGHSLTTSGKQSPDGFKEWSYTNEIVKLVMKELALYEGVAQKRIDDPTGKVDYSLTKRANDVNGFDSHIHIDHHMNAFGSGWTTAGGTETFVYSFSNEKSCSLAKKVQSNLVDALGFANRGVKANNQLYMLKNTKCDAILIEYAFMTNENEATKMRTAEYQKKAAQAVVNALVAQYGLKKKYEAKETVLNGWQKINSVWYYYKEGKKHVGWLEEKPNEWYYLEPSQGKMVSGLQIIGGKQYFFLPSGKMALTNEKGQIINA